MNIKSFIKREKLKQYHIQGMSWDGRWDPVKKIRRGTTYRDALKVFAAFGTNYSSKRMVQVTTLVRELAYIDDGPTVSIRSTRERST